MRDIFEKALIVVNELNRISPEAYISLDIQSNGKNAIVSNFPTDLKEATMFCLRYFGKFKKEDGGSILAEKDGIQLRLFGVLKCEKVGTKKIKKEIVKFTGEFEEVEVPVYSCESPLMQGE